MIDGKYQVGLIGCGSVANFHLKGWEACCERVTISALCDLVPSQIEKLKAKWAPLCGQAAAYTDYREMLAKAPLDIVCILSCGDTHLEQTTACLAAGKHISMEKPVGYSLEEARRFLHLAARYRDRQVIVAQSLRYLRAFMDLRALLVSGALGEVLTGEVSYSHPHIEGDAGTDDDGRYLNRDSDVAGGDTTLKRATHERNPYEDNGGNYVPSSTLTHATHPWDMARYLFGEAREVFSTNAFHDHPAIGPSNGVQMGILWMKSGAVVHVLAGLTRVPKVGGNQHQFVQVHGTRGSGWVMRDLHEPYERHAIYRTDGELQTAPAVTSLPESSHGTVIRSHNLLDAIEGKAKLICSMADGAHTTELLHALYLSERQQTKVTVLPGFRTG